MAQRKFGLENGNACGRSLFSCCEKIAAGLLQIAVDLLKIAVELLKIAVATGETALDFGHFCGYNDIVKDSALRVLIKKMKGN